MNSRTDYGRDYRYTWTYPIYISSVMYASCTVFGDTSTALVVGNVISIDLANQQIQGHGFGWDGTTPVNRMGFLIIGY